MTQTLKVSSKSVPHSVAGALAGIMRERESCDMQVIGAGALNQAIKAVAICRTYLVEDGIDVCCVPEFAEVDIDGSKRTAIRIVVLHRDSAATEASAGGELALSALAHAGAFDIDLSSPDRLVESSQSVRDQGR